jgi:hypothetical protein
MKVFSASCASDMRDNYSDSGGDGSKYQGEVGEPEEA